MPYTHTHTPLASRLLCGKSARRMSLGVMGGKKEHTLRVTENQLLKSVVFTFFRKRRRPLTPSLGVCSRADRGLETYPKWIFVGWRPINATTGVSKTMPLALADFGFCDPLRPHYEQDQRKMTRVVTPGPGSYDVSSIIPGINTTKYQRAATATFGESRSKRFQSNQIAHIGPGFQYTSYGRQDNSRLSLPPRTVFGKARRSVLETIKQTPGPSDYATDATLSCAPRAPAHSFSGPLAKVERFAEMERALNRNVSPGPNTYKPAACGAINKVVGSSTMGTSRRFMSLTVCGHRVQH